MKKKMRRESFAFVEDSEATKLAKEIRAECNSLSEEERAILFEQGLRLINGEDFQCQEVNARS